VEAVILGYSAVREAAVSGIPDEKWGELVAACVVLKPDMTRTEEALIRHCRQNCELHNAAPFGVLENGFTKTWR
jgi:acyl-CoA synthetase (AMP-forming)/AMP-acid ligase II